MFKLQSPSKYSPFGPIHLLRCFFHCSKQCLNSLILMPSSASAGFCFTSSTLAHRFPWRTFFIQENKKEISGQGDQVNREGGAGGSCCFDQKLLNTQPGVGRWAHKSPIMKWANALKGCSKKKSTEA